MIEQIWVWDYRLLEQTHDYIQWLFPLTESSRYNPYAPILTESDIQTFKASEELTNRLLTSFKTMMRFYGLQCIENNGKIEIQPNNEFQERQSDWLNLGNHNHLRITRILTSLRLLGLENYAQAFFKCLEKIYQTESKKIEQRSYNFWQNAIKV